MSLAFAVGVLLFGSSGAAMNASQSAPADKKPSPSGTTVDSPPAAAKPTGTPLAAPANIKSQAKTPAAGETPKPAPLVQIPPRFFVTIDPGHGGSDAGARLTDSLYEKDVTLNIARKLRSELQDRGVPAVLLRDSDTSLTYEQRALAADSQRTGLYVGIHVATNGAGIRVYTAMQPAGADEKEQRAHGPFLPWESAQKGYLRRSKTLADALVAAFITAKFPATEGVAPLKPMNNIAAPAVAIEVAPQTVDAGPESLTSGKYLQKVAVAVANAIAETRLKIEERQP